LLTSAGPRIPSLLIAFGNVLSNAENRRSRLWAIFIRPDWSFAGHLRQRAAAELSKRGDPTLDRDRLSSRPTISFEQLLKRMVEADLRALQD
jgi:hypothetical protein